jgi:hypothetical protein
VDVFIFIHSPMALYPFVGPWTLLQCRNRFYTVGGTPWTCDQQVARPLPTHRTTQTRNKRKYRHPCLEWDSNPRRHRSIERRQFMLQTARPLRSPNGCIDPYILDLGASWKWSPSRPGCFYPSERNPDTHWIGGWVGPRTGPDDVERRTNLTSTGTRTRPLGCPTRSQSLYRLRYPDSFNINMGR